MSACKYLPEYEPDPEIEAHKSLLERLLSRLRGSREPEANPIDAAAMRRQNQKEN